GLSTPVSRLMTVVLPAPFGPIKAWRGPFLFFCGNPAAAAVPPECFSQPTVSRTTGLAQRPSPRGTGAGAVPGGERLAAGAAGGRSHGVGPTPGGVGGEQAQ